MSYKITKPTNPPEGYRMLIEGQDINSTKDLIWAMEKGSQRWAHCIKQTPDGFRLTTGTGEQYKEPKQIEDYCFFRCRKMGEQR